MSNQPKFMTTNSSSRTRRPDPPTYSISIDTLESSVEKLIKIWFSRQKWNLFLNPRGEAEDLMLNRAPWRTCLTRILESTPVRVIALSLLLLDLILTILELSSPLMSCNHRENSLEEAWFHWAGIAVLGLLSVKSIALLLGLGSSFFSRPGYVVDGAVVMGALVLEAFLEGKAEGLLVVVSLWRVVRVFESAFELSDAAIEAQIEGIVCQFEALKEENRKLLDTIQEKDVIIQKLQEIIQNLQQEPMDTRN